jgi:asparagine synthase (glutamine-hydrolysing)
VNGLAGICAPSSAPELRGALDRALRSEAHRGGEHGTLVFLAGEETVALGGIGPSGRETPRDAPFASSCGRFALVYDGELYGEAPFGGRRAGRSTAELLVELYRESGSDAFARLDGSFALALVDAAERRLLLARDHLGTRPLYWHACARGLFFASEIKAILAGSGGRFAPNARIAGAFLAQTVLDAEEETFFSGIRSVRAGHCLTFDLTRPAAPPHAVRYFSIDGAVSDPEPTPAGLRRIRETFDDAVRIRLHGGERVAVMLSGGVDSSSVAAVASRSLEPGQRLCLLSGESSEARYRDPLLDLMAARLGREPSRVALGVDAKDALERLSSAIFQNDEPVRSFITVTELELKRAARELGVTSLLSGLGADEVFAGNLIHWVLYVQSLVRARRWPRAAREVASAVLSRTIRPRLRRRVLKRYFPSLAKQPVDVRGPLLRDATFRYDLGLGPGGFLDRQLADVERFSLPSLLHFDDRTSAAFGLATRLPYLDHRLVRLVAPLPPEWKLRDGYTKWLLRKMMGDDLPREVAFRKVKQGTSDAYGQWLKNDMRRPIERLFAGELAAARTGLLDPIGVRLQYEVYRAQGPDSGAVSAQDVFNTIAIELWARRFAESLD